MRRASRLLTLLLGLLVGSGQTMATPHSHRVLARVPVDGSLADVPLPVLVHLKAADGSEYALVFAPTGKLALVPGARTLAPAESAGEFVVALERRRGARDAAAALAEIVFDDGRNVVARADEDEAEALARAGFDLLRLTDTPMALYSPDPPVRLAPAGYDARVAAMAGQVTQDAVYGIARGLTGFEPVAVGGSPYTIQTRHTRSGTPIEMATQYVHERLASLGLSTSYHSWQQSATSGRNVIADLPGTTRPSEIVVVCAHLDDMPSPPSLAPGADDNASGSTAVLLAAELLAPHPFERTLRFVLFTGEEQGLYGSTAYASLLASQGANVVAVLNLDMIGYDGDANPVVRLHTRTPSHPSYAADRAIADTFRSAVTHYVGTALVPVDDPDGIPYSDHWPFWSRGWPGILAIEDDVDDFNPWYHTTGDTLARLTSAYFTSFAKASVATAAHLGVPAARPTLFEPVTPCRIVDTRDDQLPPGLGVPALAAREIRDFVVSSVCGIPADAAALAVNVTAVAPSAAGSFALWPGGGSPPGTSNVSFPAGRTRASFSVLTLGPGATFAVHNDAAGTADVVIDVSGVFR